MVFDEDLIQRVWQKGRATPERDQDEWRKDQCGAWMRREQYGGETAEFGWKIENVSIGGGDELANLKPFHWRNAFDRNTHQPRCHVTADREHVSPTAVLGKPANRPL